MFGKISFFYVNQNSFLLPCFVFFDEKYSVKIALQLNNKALIYASTITKQ